jgi:hypothetical protein
MVANMQHEECITIRFSEGLGIFGKHYGYPEIDDKELYEGATGKVADIQGIQAHAGRNFFVPEGKEFSFDIDHCPYLHIAIKAEKDADTCLFLMVHDQKPYDHIRRFAVIGKTPKGDSGCHDAIKCGFVIKDDGAWHEYDCDLRKIRDEYNYPNAGSIRSIQFFSRTGTGEHTFHFNDLFSTAKAQMKIDDQVEVIEQSIEGLIYFDYGLPADGIEVRLYGHGFGSVGKFLVSDVTDKGSYSLKYAVSNDTTSLEIRMYADNKETPLSKTLYDLGKGKKAQVNLVAPAKQQLDDSEYQRLKADLTQHIDNMTELADVQENAERQDITMLNRATGWDARLIALASIAAELSDDLEVGLSQEVLYGLFRVGLPSGKILLAQVNEETVRQALEKMMEAGIVYLDKYLFCWGGVPGSDDARLKKCLMQYFDIDWINTAKIEKSNDGNTIKATNDTNYLLLTLNDEKTNVNLEIDDVRTAEFIVKTENDELNIYLDTKKVVMDQFSTFSINTRLKVPAPGSRSTYEHLLEASGLNQDAQDKFATAYLKYGGNAAQLWVEAGKEDVISEDIQTLQLQGKLAFLTKNSEELTSRLQNDGYINDPVELARKSVFICRGDGNERSGSWLAMTRNSIN